MHDNLHLMPRSGKNKPALQPSLSEMLRTLVHIRPAPQESARGAADGRRPSAGDTWAGKDFGVREPVLGETQLSASEIAFGQYNNLF